MARVQRYIEPGGRLGITAGMMLPDINLPSSEGKHIRLYDYRGHSNLVLALLERPDCKECLDLLKDFAERYPEFDEQEAQVLAIVRGSQQDAEAIKHQSNLPFPVLADVNSVAHNAFSSLGPGGQSKLTVYVADRFGEIYSAYQSDEAMPTVDDILSWLQYIEIQCPECGVSEWPD